MPGAGSDRAHASSRPTTSFVPPCAAPAVTSTRRFRARSRPMRRRPRTPRARSARASWRRCADARSVPRSSRPSRRPPDVVAATLAELAARDDWGPDANGRRAYLAEVERDCAALGSRGCPGSAERADRPGDRADQDVLRIIAGNISGLGVSRTSASASSLALCSSKAIYLGDNLDLLPRLPDGAFTLIYVDPAVQHREGAAPAHARGRGRSRRRPHRVRRAALPDAGPRAAAPTPTASTTTSAFSSRGSARRGGCSRRTGRCTSTSIRASRTTSRCSSTRSSAASAS